MKHNNTKRGVTLVEIAIVLVIIGLLLGGILKGQELINNAKVRAIADRQNSLKVAWFAFIDRFQSIPGDMLQARAGALIPGTNPALADGNGATAGNGRLEVAESPLVFQHLTGAGYLRCPQCTVQAYELPTAANSLQNSYGGIMAIFTTSKIHFASRAAAGGNPRLLIHTGPRIPSNIISEVDRKIDDGIANGGDVVYSDLDASNGLDNAGAGGANNNVANCTNGGDANNVAAGKLNLNADLSWRFSNQQPPVEANCGAAVSI